MGQHRPARHHTQGWSALQGRTVMPLVEHCLDSVSTCMVSDLLSQPAARVPKRMCSGHAEALLSTVPNRAAGHVSLHAAPRPRCDARKHVWYDTRGASVGCLRRHTLLPKPAPVGGPISSHTFISFNNISNIPRYLYEKRPHDNIKCGRSLRQDGLGDSKRSYILSFF